MNIFQLLQLGIFWGTVFGVVFSIAMLILGRVNAEMLLNDYPPDIREKFGPMSEKNPYTGKPCQPHASIYRAYYFIKSNKTVKQMISISNKAQPHFFLKGVFLFPKCSQNRQFMS